MICSICQKEPAVYGDILTGVRCAKCEQLRLAREIQQEEVVRDEEGFKHPLKEGLVSIIMPIFMNSYTLFHYTGNAIGSIREHTDKDMYELIIIDNGSTHKVPNLQAFYADKVITNTQNLGVTAAWNKGIRASFGEYIVLINNDVQVFDSWLEGLKAVLDSGEADLVMAHPMYSLTEPFARAIESKQVWEGTKRFDNLERDFSCVMFKKSLYDEIGEFDEQFFNYCSDSDFIKRMELSGKKIKMVDKVAVHHISDATGFSIGEDESKIKEDKTKFEEKWNESKLAETVFVGEPKEIKFLRTPETGDKIYLKKDNTLHWIKDVVTFETLGGHFGDEIIMEKEEFSKYERGEPINMSNVQNYA